MTTFLQINASIYQRASQSGLLADSHRPGIAYVHSWRAFAAQALAASQIARLVA